MYVDIEIIELVLCPDACDVMWYCDFIHRQPTISFPTSPERTTRSRVLNFIFLFRDPPSSAVWYFFPIVLFAATASGAEMHSYFHGSFVIDHAIESFVSVSPFNAQRHSCTYIPSQLAQWQFVCEPNIFATGTRCSSFVATSIFGSFFSTFVVVPFNVNRIGIFCSLNSFVWHEIRALRSSLCARTVCVCSVLFDEDRNQARVWNNK